MNVIENNTFSNSSKNRERAEIIIQSIIILSYVSLINHNYNEIDLIKSLTSKALIFLFLFLSFLFFYKKISRDARRTYLHENALPQAITVNWLLNARINTGLFRFCVTLLSDAKSSKMFASKRKSLKEGRSRKTLFFKHSSIHSIHGYSNLTKKFYCGRQLFENFLFLFKEYVVSLFSIFFLFF